MRLCVALALVAMFASSAAVAAENDGKDQAKKGAKGKGKGKKKKKGKKGEPEGPNMDSTGTDPALKEQSDKGQFAPTGVTGELKAQEEASRPVKVEAPFVAPPHDKFVVFGDFVLGFGRSPRPGPASEGETTDATAFSLVAGARYDFFPAFTAGVLIPWSTANMKLPSRTDSEQEMAFGSPQILMEYRFELSRVTRLPIFLGVGIPIAQGDPDPNSAEEVAARQNTVNLHADASRGWRDGELYGVKRLPITIGLGLTYHNRGLRAHAYDKLIIGIDTGTTLRLHPYEAGKLVINDTSVRNVTLAGFTYDLMDKPELWAGADVWVVYNAVEPLDFESEAVDPSPLQLVAEPRLGIRLGKLRPNLGFIFPVGGRLHEAGISAVRAHIDYVF
jgi:hypothetical protein